MIQLGHMIQWGHMIHNTLQGNMRKHRCTICCARWFVTIDGSECSAPDNIETTIYTDSSYSIFFPTSITGSCSESAGAPIGKFIITHTSTSYIKISQVVILTPSFSFH